MKKIKLFALAIGIASQCVLIGCTSSTTTEGSASFEELDLSDTVTAVESTIDEKVTEQELAAEQQRMEQERAEQQRMQQEKAEQQRMEQEKAKQQSLVGTFEINDGHLGPIVLKVNDDETATIRYKDSETIYYGSWYKSDKYVNFHFDGEQIYINRPKAVPQLYIGGTSKFLGDFVLFEGYLYTSPSAANAKNPNERLEYKKVS